MYLVNVIETEKEKKKEGEIDGEIGKVRKSFGKIVLKEYHSGFSLFFPTQCSSAIFMIIATQYFSLFCLRLCGVRVDLRHRSCQSIWFYLGATVIIWGLAQTYINPKSISQLFQSNQTKSLLHRLGKWESWQSLGTNLSWDPNWKWNQNRIAEFRKLETHFWWYCLST